jgi:hypothetical protein
MQFKFKDMKKLLTILLLFISLTISATNYYVKNGGSDGANGLSDATAWASVDAVNWNVGFSPGDSILFKCGDVWRITNPDWYIHVKSGSAAGHVVYGAYGTGAKPLILGSKEENSTGDWADQGSNLWRNSDAAFVTGIGNIIFNNETAYGTRVFSLANVNSQGKWYYDAANDYVTIYSVGNPATYYSDIECSLRIYPGMVYIAGSIH